MFMAENSQDQDSLPLSQETCLQLFSLIGGPISNFMEDTYDQAYSTLVDDVNKIQAATPLVNGYSNNYPIINPQDVLQDENILQQFSSNKEDSMKWSSSLAIPCDKNESIGTENFNEQQSVRVSSLLGSENWPGEFSFSVSFKKQETTKGVPWLFSEERNKLYVVKDVPCPVNFSAKKTMHEEIYIRAVALFSSSEFAYEKVTRCVNHSIDDLKKNIFEAEHFIRCESKRAFYKNDDVTNRHSVIVPYENPPAGQDYSTYLYKFMCFGSCAGGPNRRPLMVVFTLERRNGEVLGRQRIELKVCACPMRDYNSDEKKKRPVEKRKTVEFSMIEPPKKVKEESIEYCIKTTDRKRYKFLKRMEILHKLYTTAKNQPNWRLFTSSQSSSGGESEM